MIKKIYIVLFFIFSLLSLGSIKAAAEVTSPGFYNFGTYKEDYTIKDNEAVSMNFPNEEKIDLRKNMIYLGYRGTDPEKDVLFNQQTMKSGVSYGLKNATDNVIVKKIGVSNGRYINAKITPILSSFVSSLTIRRNSLLESRNLLTIINYYNGDIRGFTTNIDFIYEDTGEPVELTNKYFLMQSAYTVDATWNNYEASTMLDASSKVLVGDQPRDKNTLDYLGRRIESNRQYIGFRKGILNYVPFGYNIFFKSSRLRMAGNIYTWAFGHVHLFESLNRVSSLPKPYDQIDFDNTDNGDGNIKNRIHYYIPKQDKESFIPEKVVLNDQKNVAEDLKVSEHSLFVDNELIDKTEYNYTEENIIELPKSFLKKYQDKTLEIVSDTQIDYSNQRILNEYYNKESKVFEIPYNLMVTSFFDTFEKVELDEKNICSVKYPIEITFTDLHKEIELGKSVSDYPIEEYITDLVSNFPNDDVIVTLDDLSLDVFEETTTIPATLTSSKLGISQSVELESRVYKNVPIKFKKDTGEELLPSDDLDIPKFIRQFFNKKLSFQVPRVFNNYRFSSIENKELTITDLENEIKEISGLVEGELDEIVLIYTLNESDLTVEYLLEGEGGYDSYVPIKQGENLNQEKPSINLKGIIGDNLSNFIEENSKEILPEINYYQILKGKELVTNYWHYSDEPVSTENPSNPVRSDDVIPKRPITITTVYSGVVSLEKVDNVNFGSHKNNLLIDKITSKKPINYRFIDTTKDKGIKLFLKFEKEIVNDKEEQLKSFELEYKGNSITNKEVEVVESSDKTDNIFNGDLSSDLLFKRYWVGPENFGKYEGTLVWSLARDITF